MGDKAHCEISIWGFGYLNPLEPKQTIELAHLPCVEGVTKPSPGAASAFSSFQIRLIFPLQFASPMGLLHQIGRPRQDVLAAIRQDHQIVFLFKPQTNTPFTNNQTERDLRPAKVKQSGAPCVTCSLVSILPFR